jgi:hypothetical protein
MSDNGKTRVMDAGRAAAGLFIGVAVVVATSFAAGAWERVKTRPPERTLAVTGSAKKRITSDRIIWKAELTTQDADRTTAYRALAGHIKSALAYLEAQGIKKEDVRVSSASVEEVHEREFQGVGAERVEHDVMKGFKTSQSLTVESADVTRVERVSREITQLLEQGVPIASSEPLYLYTRIGELKIEMLAAAAGDARLRAEKMLAKAGGAAIARLRSADMGVININPANTSDTKWDGNNDQTSLEKDILTIVHVTFELQ